MEPYGAERSQRMATGRKSDGGEDGPNRQETVAVGCDRLPPRFHGQEEVDRPTPEGIPSRRLCKASAFGASTADAAQLQVSLSCAVRQRMQGVSSLGSLHRSQRP
jgi:hypothetical protein